MSLNKNSTAGEVRTKLKLNLRDENIVVTGGNSGLGKETARVLALSQANVPSVSRRVQVQRCGRRDSKRTPKLRVRRTRGSSARAHAQLRPRLLPLHSHLRKEWYARKTPLNVLVNNAGVAACPPSLTEDDFEMQWGVNYLGHFLLTQLLMDSLESATGNSSGGGEARIVNLSSELHFHIPFVLDKAGSLDAYKIDNGFLRGPHWTGYGLSKSAMVLTTLSLHKRLLERQSRVTVNALQPGWAASTDMVRHLPWHERWINQIASALVGKSVAQASATMVYVAAAPQLKGVSGKYFAECAERSPAPHASDMVIAERLWELSAKQCHLDEALKDVNDFRKEKGLL